MATFYSTALYKVFHIDTLSSAFEVAGCQPPLGIWGSMSSHLDRYTRSGGGIKPKPCEQWTSHSTS